MPNDQAQLTSSIAMCTYNAEKFVDAQLESFLIQTRLPDELVIQDDASEDSTPERLEAFAKRAPFAVRIERNESRLGPTGNFERAMTRCSSDVVFFSDADDIWRADRIVSAIECFDREPAIGCVFSDAELTDEHMNPRGLTLWESIGFASENRKAVLAGALTDAFFRRTIGFGGAMAVRRKVLQAALPIARPWGHDNWTAIVAAALFDVAFVERPLMQYRQHGSQYSGGTSKSLWSRIQTSRTVKAKKDWVPTGASYGELARRLSELRGRATDVARLNRAIADAEAKHKHQLMRESLSDRVYRRIPPVLADAARLRYRRYSNGLLSALRDIAFGKF